MQMTTVTILKSLESSEKSLLSSGLDPQLIAPLQQNAADNNTNLEPMTIQSILLKMRAEMVSAVLRDKGDCQQGETGERSI